MVEMWILDYKMYFTYIICIFVSARTCLQLENNVGKCFPLYSALQVAITDSFCDGFLQPYVSDAHLLYG